jgi:hypothetical protein
MKIRISEDQAKRLFIKENVDVVTKFERLCDAYSKELDKNYLHLISLSIDDILTQGEFLNELERKVSIMESKVLDEDKKAYEQVKSLSQEDLEIRLDNAYNKISGKSSVIQLLILQLEELRDLSIEHKFSKSFSNIKTIEV